MRFLRCSFAVLVALSTGALDAAPQPPNPSPGEQRPMPAEAIPRKPANPAEGIQEAFRAAAAMRERAGIIDTDPESEQGKIEGAKDDSLIAEYLVLKKRYLELKRELQKGLDPKK